MHLLFDSSTKKGEKGGSDVDDLSDIANISLKVKTLMDKIQNTLTDRYSEVDIRVAFPALYQLHNELEAQNVESLQASFIASGEKVKPQDLEGIRESLDFAEWAYIENTPELKANLKTQNYSLLKHDLFEEAGYVGHYVAINAEKKTALIGIKGTSSLQDAMTDCCADSVPFSLDSHFVSKAEAVSQEIVCHEGILISAKRLADDIQPFLEHLFLPLDYEVLICGHSLGAGAASLVAPLLRSRNPMLIEKNSIQVRAFACPPVLNYESAIACSPFVTTIVNSSDIIPRASVANLKVLHETFFYVYKKLEEKGMHAKDFKSTRAFFSWLGKDKSEESIMTFEEALDMLQRSQEAVDLKDRDHLHIPGRVLFMMENDSPITDNAENEGGKEDIKKPDTDCIVTDGGNKYLRTFIFDERMVVNHFAAAYNESVNSVLSSL